jgi:hypothetical protein
MLPIKIVILNRGWVMVGRVTEKDQKVIITNCSVIRVWGTTKGLGEIAFNGPTEKTILDPCPTFTAHKLTVVGVMDVTESKWTKYVK